MTFDLPPFAVAARDRARAAAARLDAAAAATDQQARIAAEVRGQARAALVSPRDPLAWVVGVEELATASGSLAVDAALGVPEGDSQQAAPWSGLRGVNLPAARAAGTTIERGLAVAAVLVGLGRSALDLALRTLAAAGGEGGGPEQRHWTVADAATELDAARLLLWRAASAGTGGETAVAMARLQARTAAEAAVAAARRACASPSAEAAERLDRLTRDVATATLVFGGADADESAVAAGVLPAAGRAPD